MTITISQSDLGTITKAFGYPTPTITKELEISKKLGFLGADISMAVTTYQGGLLLDITKAKVAGLGLFGVVRKKAVAAIFEKLVSIPIFSTSRLEGNIFLEFPQCEIVSVVIDKSVTIVFRID